jgi:FixJ family two-component response regulator
MTLDLADFDHNDFAKRLRERGACPIIFISDRNDVASAVKVMRAGAIDFLTKPIDANILLGAIRLALNYDVSARAFNAELATLQSRFSTLTPRERQVLSLVIGGMRNKQAAAALGIREVTLQVHRSQVMRKMFAHSFAELVRMSITLGISFERVPTWRAAHANMTPPTLNRGRMLAD